MTRYLRALGLTVALLATTAVACTPPSTIQTPQGQAAYRADQVVVRLNELQNVAITANQQGQLPTATTRVIVQFVVTADRALAASPQGWQAIVKQGWAALVQELPPINNPSVIAALTAVQVVVQSL